MGLSHFEEVAARIPSDNTTISVTTHVTTQGDIVLSFTNPKFGIAECRIETFMVPAMGPKAALWIGENLISNSPFDRLTSPNGNITLVLQSDGVLTLSDVTKGEVLWKSSNTADSLSGPYKLKLQPTDGHLVLYSTLGRAAWSTGIFNKPPTVEFLEVTNEGALLLKSTTGSTLWSAGFQ
jgi:hypothetical protein